MRPDPPVISIRAMAPSGTTFSIPVKAVPAGVTVVPLTDVVPEAVVPEVVVPEVVVPEVVVPEVVPEVVVPEVVVLEVVVPEVVVPVVVVSVVVACVVVVLVVVDVVVEPAVQCEIVRTTEGTGPESSQVQVTTALVFWALVAGPGTSALKLLPWGDIGMLGPPFTLIDTLLTPSASFPNPVRIHRVVPLHGTKPAPFTWFQLVCWVLANAAVGKIAHAIIKSVAAETEMRPAIVSLRPCLALTCAGICSS